MGSENMTEIKKIQIGSAGLVVSEMEAINMLYP